MRTILSDFWHDAGSDSHLTLFSGIIGLAGCGFVVVAHVTTVLLLDSFNPITETISDLAAGYYGWIMDTGLVIYAISLLVCALGLHRWRLSEGNVWRLGLAMLVLAGLNVFVIATYNEYGNYDPGGLEIHIYLVCVLGFSFAASVALLGRGFRHIHPRLQWQSLALAGAWVVLAPPFVLVDLAWVGLYELFLAALMLLWTARVSWLLVQRGRQGEGALT